MLCGVVVEDCDQFVRGCRLGQKKESLYIESYTVGSCGFDCRIREKPVCSKTWMTRFVEGLVILDCNLTNPKMGGIMAI